MNTKEALHVLHLDGSPSHKQVMKAYRLLAFKLHPGKNQEDSLSNVCLRRVIEAKEFLIKVLDRSCEVGSLFEDYHKARHEDIVSGKLVKPGRLPVSGTNLHIGRIGVPMSAFLFGEEVTLSTNVKTWCHSCLDHNTSWRSCNGCQQTGKLVRSKRGKQYTTRCQSCHGFGWLRRRMCETCHNSLEYMIIASLSFIIPEGHQPGESLIISGEGHRGWRPQGWQPKVCNGDVFVTPVVKVPNLRGFSEENRKILKRILNQER